MAYLDAFIEKVRREDISESEAADAIKHLHDAMRRDIKQVRSASSRNVLDDLIRLLRETTGFTEDAINPDLSLTNYGFNSVSLTEFSSKISQLLPQVKLAPSVFLDHNSLSALARCIETRLQADAASSTLDPATVSAHLEQYFRSSPRPERQAAPTPRRPSPGDDRRKGEGRPDVVSGDIAIIGMSARLPRSEDLADFWRRLVADEPFVTEAPADRWDWRALHGDPREANKTDCHQGAFIDDVRSFDALHFNIAPSEAALMDPQHRLALEAVWETLESAGYSNERLRRRKVGVYFGVERKDYADLLRANGLEIDGHLNTGNAHAMLVNRIAHFFDWRGPVSVVDAACTSSFVALEEAVFALRSGRAEAAIVGGVHLVLSSDVHIYNRKLGLFTGAGVVRPFDKQADGHFFSDGVGVVLLKPLAAAERDDDNILGLIKGISVRHGGKSLYLTAPNAEVHRQVIAEALEQAGLAPENVDYIEAQGAANPMADDVELNAFHSVFKDREAPGPSLGALKGQLGHFSGASGIIALIKNLMALKNDTLVKIANFKDFIWDSEREPFACEPLRETTPWAPKLRGGERSPRHVSIHNFGFGGVTGHLVLGERLDTPRAEKRVARSGLHAVPLSARTTDQLRRQAGRLLDFLRDQTHRFYGVAEPDLEDIAYTLQTGREHFERRAIFFADSVRALTTGLELYLAGEEDSEAFLQRDLDSGKDVRLLFASPEMRSAMGRWLETRDVRSLGRVWAAGVTVDWAAFYEEERPPRKVMLPTYPFARKPLWMPVRPMNRVAGAGQISPMLHRNTSDFSTQRYASTFSGDEPWFHADASGGRRFIELAHLDMIAAAAFQAANIAADEQVQVQLREMRVAQALRTGGEPLEVVTVLTPVEDGEIEYRISSAAGSAQRLHLEGRAVLNVHERRPTLDVAELKRAGAAQGVHERDEQAPSLYAQITALLAARSGEAGALRSIDEASRYGSTDGASLIWLRAVDGGPPADASRFDVDVCDADGRISLQLRGLVWSAEDETERMAPSMPSPFMGMIPTLNGSGAMTAILPACSEMFVDFAASAGGEVMDMGCAYGVAAIAALKRGATLLAVDIEPQHLTILENSVEPSLRGRLSTRCGALPEMDLPNARFAAIHAARVLHFLPPEAFRASIRKMARWLAPGGKLFVICDSPYFPHWAARVAEYERLAGEGASWPGYVADIADYFRSRAHAGAGEAMDSGGHAAEALNGVGLINLVDPEILIRECELAGLDVEEAGYEGLAIDQDGPASAGLEHASIVAIKPLRSKPVAGADA